MEDGRAGLEVAAEPLQQCGPEGLQVPAALQGQGQFPAEALPLGPGLLATGRLPRLIVRLQHGLVEAALPAPGTQPQDEKDQAQTETQDQVEARQPAGEALGVRGHGVSPSQASSSSWARSKS